MLERERIETIIARYLAREASAGEKDELQAWLSEDPSHRDHFDKLERIWKETEKLGSSLAIDVPRAWEALDAKIRQQPVANRGMLLRIRPRTLAAIAAAILLFFGAGLLYRMNQPRQEAPVRISATDANRRITFPDGSVALLRKGSSLEYSGNFGRADRQLTLAGEAFFDVVPEPSMPFRIGTERSLIEVVGTSFFVRSAGGEEQVFVVKGKVKISEKKDPSNAVIVSMGQQSALIGKQFEKESITDSNYMSWESGVLRFDNASLRSVVRELSRNFQVHIGMAAALEGKSDSIRVHLRFENNSLNEVLDELLLTTGLVAERNGDSILLTEKTPR